MPLNRQAFASNCVSLIKRFTLNKRPSFAIRHSLRIVKFGDSKKKKKKNEPWPGKREFKVPRSLSYAEKVYTIIKQQQEQQQQQQNLDS